MVYSNILYPHYELIQIKEINNYVYIFKEVPNPSGGYTFHILDRFDNNTGIKHRAVLDFNVLLVPFNEIPDYIIYALTNMNPNFTVLSSISSIMQDLGEL